MSSLTHINVTAHPHSTSAKNSYIHTCSQIMENTFVKHNQWLLTVLHLTHKNLIRYTVHIVYLFLLGTLHFFYLSTLHFKDQWSKEDSWWTEDTPCYYPTKAIKTYMNKKALLIKIKHTKYYPQTAVITSIHTHVWWTYISNLLITAFLQL